MSTGLGLCLWLGLSHHGRAERVHGGWLTGPGGGLGNVGRRPRGGARAAGVKGRGAAVETAAAVSSAPNTAAAQVHWQSLLWEEGGNKRLLHESVTHLTSYTMNQKLKAV